MHIVTTYSYTIESLVQCIEKGFALEFVSIAANSPTRPSRLFRSKANFVFRSATTLLRVFLMFHPLKTLTWLSAMLAAVGLIPIVRFPSFTCLGKAMVTCSRSSWAPHCSCCPRSYLSQVTGSQMLMRGFLSSAQNLLSKINFESVLEVGYGPGDLAARILPPEIDYLGIDFDASQVQLAKHRYPQ